MNPEYVGILLNAKTHRGIKAGRTGKEALPFYEDAAAAYGLIPCYLRLEDLRAGQETSPAFLKHGKTYIRTLVPTPKVIHNRAIYTGRTAGNRIAALQKQGITVFNANTRYRKDEIHRLLAGHPELAAFQPYTLPATLGSIGFMMERYPDLLLKPASGSVGKGIMRLRREDNGWKLLYRSSQGRRRGRWTELRLGNVHNLSLPLPVVRRLRQVPYLVQERLPLAEFDGRPFDLRITVQRGLSGEWGVTGLFAKLSPPGGFLSNIAQGGSAFPAESILSSVMTPSAAAGLLAAARKLALKTAEFLSARLPLLGDLGLDIGITASGKLYFIECNGRDQRYGFHEAGMDSVWRETYCRPMAFARHLLLRQALQQAQALQAPSLYR